MSAQIVVSGGAGFWSGDDGLALDRYALGLTGKTRPRVCHLATASGDAEAFITGFYDGLGTLCEASHLSLFLPPFEDPATMLAEQDLIYVGGGSTPNLLAVWRIHGIDQLIRAALERGTILYGSSAGGLCWFESGVTDSLGFDGSLRPLTNGLGLLPGSHCPHFDEPSRRTVYAELVQSGQLVDGVGIDDYAAVHYVDGDVVATISGDGRAQAYRVERTIDTTAAITPLPSRRA